ncbi:MAG: hypothetical protein AMJ78_04135 [Omnitrophica WOR_2 bacterium SM23_29]|nr:MAG: hypothetical protein AMJ78_04135 [Omnitrophica WOR_2 bacterium SM23_29]
MHRKLIYSLSALIVFVSFGFNLIFAPEGIAQEKELSLTGILRTSYALGGDVEGVEGKGEEIYVAKGTINKVLSVLRGILIEHKRPVRSFRRKDLINIIVFRGILPAQGKIEITRVASKDNAFEVHAKYFDFSELDIPSQPAAIIPLGKLPRGKYSAALYVDGQLHKKVEFKIR